MVKVDTDKIEGVIKSIESTIGQLECDWDYYNFSCGGKPHMFMILDSITRLKEIVEQLKKE